MGSLGWPEILIILVVALIIFGPRKLPELGKTLGESLAQFRRASEDFKRTWEAEVEYEKARIDSPKPADTSYSYSSSSSESNAAAPVTDSATEGSSPATGVTTPIEGTGTGAAPEGTVPSHDPAPASVTPETVTPQPAS